MTEDPPVSAETLIRMATFYLARYSASTARLREVLARKIRTRCERRGLPIPDEAEVRAMIEAAVERLTRAGLIDDEIYARGRTRTLAAKGWPGWRIRADLERHEIDAGSEALTDMMDIDEAGQARRLARRKRIGPFRTGEREPYRDKDVAALARAGFPVSVARLVVDGDGEA